MEGLGYGPLHRVLALYAGKSGLVAPHPTQNRDDGGQKEGEKEDGGGASEQRWDEVGQGVQDAALGLVVPLFGLLGGAPSAGGELNFI